MLVRSFCVISYELVENSFRPFLEPVYLSVNRVTNDGFERRGSLSAMSLGV